MFHLFLFILKIIGWILLAVLGLLVLLVCLVLFLPVHYYARADGKGDVSSLEAQLVFHILFRLASFQLYYKDGRPGWKARIFWKIFQSGTLKGEALKEDVVTLEKQVQTIEENVFEKKPEDSAVKEEKSPPQKEEGQKNDFDKKEETTGKRKKKTGKIQTFFKKIKYTFQKICDKIKLLLEKKESLEEFLAEEAHITAFIRAAAELKRFFFRLKPKKIRMELEFGFQRPSLTGAVLAVLCMICPMLGDQATFQPDFERQVFRGTIFVNGKIQFLSFVIFLWNLIWDKNVRTTFGHIKEFKKG